MKTKKRFIILLRLGLTVMALTGQSSIRAANAATGVLSFVEAHFDDTGLDGAYSVAVSPDGCHVYAAVSVDDAVVAELLAPITSPVGMVHPGTPLALD